MIQVDGSNVTKMPTTLTEYYEYARSDTFTLNDTMQRNQIAKKRCAEMSWNNIKQTDIAGLLAWAETVTSHTYKNDSSSKFANTPITCLVTITTPGAYIAGGSYMIDTFAVKFREV